MMSKLKIKIEYLLIAATLILLLVSYKFAFKNTIIAWQLNSELKAKLNQATDLSSQPGYLERKSLNLDRVINTYKADTTLLRSNLINIISLLADRENVKLSEVPIKDISYDSDKFIYEKLTFEGDYFSLLRLNNDFEHKKYIGMIRSEVLKVKETRTNSEKSKMLSLDIFLEIVK